MDDTLSTAGPADGAGTCPTSGLGTGSTDTTETARRWLGAAGAVAIATVVRTWGSAPLPAGAQLVIGTDGQCCGSLAGGCVEREVESAAREMLKAGAPAFLLLASTVSDAAAQEAGLPCGGQIELFVARLAGAADARFLDDILAAHAARSLLVVETALADGQRTVHRDTDTFNDETARRLSAGESLLIEDAQGRRFLHAHVPAVRVILVGDGQIARALADLAQRVGFQVTMVDPRMAPSASPHFSGAAVSIDWPEAALPALGLDARTAVVTLAHEARLDDETLTAALRSRAFYVGALGSRRTHEKRVARLSEAGLTDAEIARIDAPVGLSIGARGPAEIAVSILAAIIKARHGA